MMCTLYYTHGSEEYRIGSFRNQEKARTFWKALKPSLEAKFGKNIKPIFRKYRKGEGQMMDPKCKNCCYYDHEDQQCYYFVDQEANGKPMYAQPDDDGCEVWEAID